MKNSISISNNVNLILNTYRSLFFSNCYRESSMLFDIFDQAKQDESARQRGNGKVLESATFEFENHIGAKMVDV